MRPEEPLIETGLGRLHAIPVHSEILDPHRQIGSKAGADFQQLFRLHRSVPLQNPRSFERSGRIQKIPRIGLGIQLGYRFKERAKRLDGALHHFRRDLQHWRLLNTYAICSISGADSAWGFRIGCHAL
jgi:hypothetical protein